jgi:tRNA isopentenyl-2-thiomethyl-A-37 hydroxylase MiaE
MLRPKLKVLFTHPLTCDPTTLPLVCWQMVIIQTPHNDKIVDPVLTFARDNTVHFYQVLKCIIEEIIGVVVTCFSYYMVFPTA